MIHGCFLEYDEGVWTLCLDDDMGTHRFNVDPQDVDRALAPWRQTQAEMEEARHEARIAAVWPEYYACLDPEGDFAEMLREQGDFLRKRGKEAA